MNNKTTIEQLQVRKLSGVQFAVCGSCLWCASILQSATFTSCPSCRNEMLDFIPVSTGENYSFDYDEKRGIVLDFAPAKRQ